MAMLLVYKTHSQLGGSGVECKEVSENTKVNPLRVSILNYLQQAPCLWGGRVTDVLCPEGPHTCHLASK